MDLLEAKSRIAEALVESIFRRARYDVAPYRAPASPLILATRAGASVLTVVTVTSLAHLLGPKWSGLVAGFPVNGLPVMAILHYQYGADVIKPFIRIFPAGAFGICLFNLVASVCLVPLGLVAAITLAYGVDIAYLIAVSRLGRPSRPGRSS